MLNAEYALSENEEKKIIEFSYFLGKQKLASQDETRGKECSEEENVPRVLCNGATQDGREGKAERKKKNQEKNRGTGQ